MSTASAQHTISVISSGLPDAVWLMVLDMPVTVTSIMAVPVRRNMPGQQRFMAAFQLQVLQLRPCPLLTKWLNDALQDKYV